jgi:sugar O-acyltransferase (sialic acid O-acetyltransferase NeuD family)
LKRLAIIGASGHGKVVAEIAVELGWDTIVFFDAEWPKMKTHARWPVVGSDSDSINHINSFDGFFVAIGDNEARCNLSSLLTSVEVKLVNLIHPSSVVSSSAQIGRGVAVMPGVVVNADSILGNGVILNTACIIEHDCRIEAFVHVSPGAHLAGGVSIGELSWVGIGSSIKEGLSVGANVVVGAGSVVLQNVKSNLVVFGIPAKSR